MQTNFRENGSTAAAEIRDQHQALNDKAFACLTDEERGQLGILLGKLVAALEQEVPTGRLCSRGHERHPRGCGRSGGRSGRSGQGGGNGGRE